MRKFFKFLLYFVLLIVVVVTALLTYVKLALPNVGAAENIKIDYTPERIERGRYLANAVSVCMDCHSSRDWSQFSGPLKQGTLGMGGETFDQKAGLPGVYISKNITPEGIARYTDGELYRVITTGVSKEGKALFPVMPFGYYGRMDREDIYAIIAYVRSLPPLKNDVPDSRSDFPMNFIINTIPHKEQPQTRPDTTDLIAYGTYMTNASACRECHTQVEKGQIIQELAFSGGREFRLPAGILRTSNITMDEKTGIGKWTEEQFIQRFKLYTDSSYHGASVKSGEFNTIMPWLMYSRMTRKDLSAIFTYLKSVKPIANEVEKFTPAGGK